MTNPAAFEAKLDAMRRTQDGVWKVTLSVHPSDMPDWLFHCPPGQRLGAAALHRIDDDPRDEAKAVERKDSQRADYLCKKDTVFRRWIRAHAAGEPRNWHQWSDLGADAAVDDLRKVLLITSRRQIDADDRINRAWHVLVEQFERDTGRVTVGR